jgi:acetyltransferase-like isoleucine patch superfamily enzyme
MVNPVEEYHRRLVEAGLSTGDRISAMLGLGLKAGPMIVRGAILKPLLTGCDGIPLLGKGVRVRGARQLSAGRGLVIEDYAEVQATSRDGVRLGEHVSIGSMTMIRPSGYYSRDIGVGLHIGDRTGIGPYCYIGCSGGIEIGSDVMFGPGVMLYSEDHEFASPKQSIKSQGVRWQPIVIEDDCWLASRVIVTGGVRVGRGSVIGAGAVVTRDVPPFSVVAGNPAKILRSRTIDE